MEILYQKFHKWPLSNIEAFVKVVREDGKIRVWVNNKEKTTPSVQEEIFNTIGWHPPIQLGTLKDGDTVTVDLATREVKVSQP